MKDDPLIPNPKLTWWLDKRTKEWIVEHFYELPDELRGLLENVALSQKVKGWREPKST